MNFYYQLEYKEYSLYNALTWNNCIGHAKKAFQGSLSLKDKAVHITIAAIECFPVIGQIVSLLELILFKVISSLPSNRLLKGSVHLIPPSPRLDQMTEAKLNLASTYFQKLIAAPYTLLDDEKFKLDFPNLNICRCIEYGCRSNLEKTVIDQMEKYYPDKEKELTVVSMGVGECFQELVYLAKLVQAGYKKIHLVTIDHSQATLRSIEDLKKFKNRFIQTAEINITHYSKADQYQQEALVKKVPVNLLLMIDLEVVISLTPPSIVDHAFLEIRPRVSEGTIIAYTSKEIMTKSDGSKFIGSQTVCCRFIKEADNLSQMNERIVYTPSTSF